MSRRVWKHRITDIIDSIKKIQKYVEKMGFDDFQKDEKTIDAVIRNFIIIGEAARHVPDDISTKYANIPWRFMEGNYLLMLTTRVSTAKIGSNRKYLYKS